MTFVPGNHPKGPAGRRIHLLPAGWQIHFSGGAGWQKRQGGYPLYLQKQQRKPVEIDGKKGTIYVPFVMLTRGGSGQRRFL